MSAAPQWVPVASNRHNLVRLNFAELIHAGLSAQALSSEAIASSIEEIYRAIVAAPNPKLGQLAFPCFTLAKKLKKNPAEVSSTLAAHMPSHPFFMPATAVGPYLNAQLSAQGLAQLVTWPILSGKYFARKIKTEAPPTMLEFSQPNTHKELHVGHMRNLCLGAALLNILRYTQAHVLSATFPGDLGTHVAKCLWYLKYHNKTEPPATRAGAWLGRMYSLAHNKLEDELGTPQENINRAQLTEIIKQIESGQGEFFELWQRTRTWSLELMNEVYDWAGVKFDRWYTESEVDKDSQALARRLYAEGLLIESEGAIGMDLTAEGLGFCMLIKSDGTGLYATKDVELARRKFAEGIIRNVYVVDDRQSLHFKQVFKVLERAGFLKPPQLAYHLPYEMVELPSGAMSSRKGNIVPITDLIENMEAEICARFFQPSAAMTLSAAEIQSTARMIAVGAIKYGMLRVDNNRKIIFDMNEWLKLDGETGPYLQYVYARIQSVISKAAASGIELPHATLIHPDALTYLEEPVEIDLAARLIWFNDTVEQCADQLKSIHLTNYLFELGRAFNSFYAECPILKNDNAQLRFARLGLAQAVGLIMAQGLKLLGIPAPPRM